MADKDTKTKAKAEAKPDDTDLMSPKTPAAIAAEEKERREASGVAVQAMEAAETPEEMEEAQRTEEAPKPNEGTEDNPVADDSPDIVTGEGDSWPNYMSSAGLNPIQKARVEGTPIDGANGANFLAVVQPNSRDALHSARQARQATDEKGRKKAKPEDE